MPIIIAGGGGGAGATTQIGVTTLAVTTASIAFASINQTFTHLWLVCNVRTDNAAGAIEFDLRLNGDSGANYDFTNAISIGSAVVTVTAVAANTCARLGAASAATAVAGASGMASIIIPNYTATTFFKTWSGTGFRKDANAVGNLINETPGGSWRNTAAVTALSVACTTGSNLAPGSSVSLYGIT